jgi:hypothetical protein
MLQDLRQVDRTAAGIQTDFCDTGDAKFALAVVH